jgi:hypothetical protein
LKTRICGKLLILGEEERRRRICGKLLIVGEEEGDLFVESFCFLVRKKKHKKKKNKKENKDRKV